MNTDSVYIGSPVTWKKREYIWLNFTRLISDFDLVNSMSIVFDQIANDWLFNTPQELVWWIPHIEFKFLPFGFRFFFFFWVNHLMNDLLASKGFHSEQSTWNYCTWSSSFCHELSRQWDFVLLVRLEWIFDWPFFPSKSSLIMQDIKGCNWLSLQSYHKPCWIHSWKMIAS